MWYKRNIKSYFRSKNVLSLTTAYRMSVPVTKLPTRDSNYPHLLFHIEWKIKQTALSLKEDSSMNNIQNVRRTYIVEKDKAL